MGANSKIEWTDHTFNPWIGCTRVSPGCDDCYAARSTPARTLRVAWGADQQAAAFKATHGRRQRVFCASLADVFDNAAPDAWRADLFHLIACTPDLDWLLLTKRIGNAAEMVDSAVAAVKVARLPNKTPAWPWLNVWIGATVVDQAEAERDIPKLLAVPARVRFLSVEPMLGRMYIEDIPDPVGGVCLKPLNGLRWVGNGQGRNETRSLGGRIDWVICGGESGPKARPMHPDWARSLRDQCAAASVAFLFKQWGEWTEFDDSGLPGVRRVIEGDPEFSSQASKCDAFMACDGTVIATMADAADGIPYRGLVRAGKHIAGRMLDGRTHDEVPTP